MLKRVSFPVPVTSCLVAAAALFLMVCPTASADVIKPGYGDVESRKTALLSGKFFVTAERRSKVTNVIRTDSITGERITIYRVETGSRLVSYSASGNFVLLVQSRVTTPKGASPRVATHTATLMNNDGSDQRIVSLTRGFQQSKHFCGAGIDWGAVHSDRSVLISKVKYSRLDGTKRRPCVGDDGRAHAPRYGYRLSRIDTATGTSMHHDLFSDPGIPGESEHQFSPDGRLLALNMKRGWKFLHLVTGKTVIRRLSKRFADATSATISDEGALAFVIQRPPRFRGDRSIHTSHVLYPNILATRIYREIAGMDDWQVAGRFCGRQYVVHGSAWPLQLVGYDVADPATKFTYSFPTPADSYEYRISCDAEHLLAEVKYNGVRSRHLKPLAH